MDELLADEQEVSSDRQILTERHAAEMELLKEQSTLRRRLEPLLTGGTLLMLWFTIALIFILFFVDIIAMVDCSHGDCSKTLDAVKYVRLIDQNVILALIAATVAELAAMAYAMVAWGYGGAKRRDKTDKA